jgi:hypothetical protein
MTFQEMQQDAIAYADERAEPGNHEDWDFHYEERLRQLQMEVMQEYCKPLDYVQGQGIFFTLMTRTRGKIE